MAINPQEMQQSGMATPEQKQQLLDMIDTIKGKVGEVNTATFATTNESVLAKSDALKEVFAILRQAGVDLTDPKSVSQFLESLRGMNPEMAQLFEDSLNSLLGDGIDQQNIMNTNNETLPQNIRGPGF